VRDAYRSTSPIGALEQALEAALRTQNTDDIEGSRLRYTLGASSVRWPQLDVEISILALLGLPDE
jgi:hypothetical protein